MSYIDHYVSGLFNNMDGGDREETERSPLLNHNSYNSTAVHNSYSDPDQNINNEQPSSDKQKDEEKFTFSSIPKRKRYLLITMAFCNFCATCCFSLLAPFFPREVNIT